MLISGAERDLLALSYNVLRYVHIALILRQYLSYLSFASSMNLLHEPGRGEVKVLMKVEWIHSFCVAKQREMGVNYLAMLSALDLLLGILTLMMIYQLP